MAAPAPKLPPLHRGRPKRTAHLATAWITTCEWHETYLADWNNKAVPGAVRTRSSVRTEHFTRLLTGEQVRIMGHELAGNCREADDGLDIVQPFVLARDERDAGELVHLWCQAVGISGPYRSAFERIRHPAVRRVLALQSGC